MKLFKLLCCSLLSLSLIGCSSQEDKEPIKDQPVIEEKLDIIGNDIYASPEASKVNNAMIRAFNQLSLDLDDENVELSQIAKDVATCFAYDFFSFKGKVDQSDVGGLAYLPEGPDKSFASYASLTYYKNYEKILNEYGKDSLLEVIDVEVSNVTEQSVIYENTEYNGFIVDANLTYAETKVDQAKLKTSIQVTCIDIYNGIIVITGVK